MKYKIEWNNYMHSSNQWADYLNDTYPLKNKLRVKLTTYSNIKIFIESGIDRKSHHTTEYYGDGVTYIGFVNLDFLAKAILDENKLDFEPHNPNNNKSSTRTIHIKGKKTSVGYLNYVKRDREKYSELMLNDKSAPFIYEKQLIKFATDDSNNCSILKTRK